MEHASIYFLALQRSLSRFRARLSVPVFYLLSVQSNCILVTHHRSASQIKIIEGYFKRGLCNFLCIFFPPSQKSVPLFHPFFYSFWPRPPSNKRIFPYFFRFEKFFEKFFPSENISDVVFSFSSFEKGKKNLQKRINDYPYKEKCKRRIFTRACRIINNR